MPRFLSFVREKFLISRKPTSQDAPQSKICIKAVLKPYQKNKSIQRLLGGLQNILPAVFISCPLQALFLSDTRQGL